MRLCLSRRLAAAVFFYGVIFSAQVRASGDIPGAAKVATVTFEETIMFALNRDPSVNQQAAQMGIGQAQIDGVMSGWKPQIGLTGSLGRNQTTDSTGSLNNASAWGVTLTQLLYDFGKTRSALGQTQAQYDSYRYQFMATLSSVAEKAALGYVQVKRYGELSRAARESINALEQIQRMAQLRADAGLSSSSDVLQTQTRMAGMRSTMAQYEAELFSARARLAVLSGVDAGDLSPIPDVLAVPQDPLDNIDYSLIPSVMAARAMETSAQFSVDRARSQHWPTLSLKGGRTYYESNNRRYWDDNVELSIDAPIYQGGAVSAQIRQMQSAKSMASSQVDQARFDVLQKASVAMADWLGARARRDVDKQQIINAQRARQVYKNEYTLNKRSINDLLSVEQDVWQAELSRITSEYDSWNAAISYATAIDTLLPLVGIKKKAAALPDLN